MQDLALSGAADFETALAAGAVQYDATAAGNCHATFASDPCAFADAYLFTPTLYELLADCHAIVGLVPANSPCVVTEQCVPTAYCDYGSTCPGTCVTRSNVDGPCTWSGECADGLSCGTDDLCNTRSDVSGPCTWDGDCADGLQCDGATQTCGGRIPQGGACIGANDALRCEEGLYCSSENTTPGTCVPVGGAGAACTIFSRYDQCQRGLDCYEPTGAGSGRCTAPSTVGGPCAWGLTCQSGLRCGNDLLCATLAGVGETCSTAWGAPPCANGLTCDGSTCLDSRYFGEACGANVGACAEGVCVDGQCVARSSVGAVCTASDDCATGKCSGDGHCIDGIGCN